MHRICGGPCAAQTLVRYAEKPSAAFTPALTADQLLKEKLVVDHEALRHESGLVSAHFNLGIALESQQKTIEALRAYPRSLAVATRTQRQSGHGYERSARIESGRDVRDAVPY